MPRSWTSSPELHLDLNVSVGRGRRAALERALRDAVRDGRLAPRTVLPSTRALARDLHLARGTVVDAYAQLVAEGYLVARPGSVTAVADTATAAGHAPPVAAHRTSRPRIDLRPGLLDLASTFPREAWLRAERAVLRTAPDEVFDYLDPRGTVELRTALADYLGRVRGVVAAPEQIVICAGVAHGLTLLGEVQRGLGHGAVAMEDPCLPAHRDIVRSAGLDPVPIPVDDDGLVVADLERARACRVVLVTPAHQYPTGATMSPARRLRLVKWAQRADGFVIEDDYDGEFRYDRQPVGAIQGLDPERVVYAGTTSKTLAPGVRLGWLVLPRQLVDPVVEVVRVRAALPPALPQLTLAHLLARGDLDRHLRRLRVGYRRRRDALVRTLADAVPALHPAGIAAGLHILLYLGTGTTESDVRKVAEEHGIALAYLGSHWHEAAGREHGVVIGYARPPTTVFDDVLQDLVGVLRLVVDRRRR